MPQLARSLIVLTLTCVACGQAEGDAIGSPPGSDRASVALNETHGCALRDDGQTACWGWIYSAFGEGHAEAVFEENPRVVEGLPRGFHALSAWVYGTCGLTERSDVWCWGANSAEEPLVPHEVEQFHGKVQQLAMGYAHACLLTHSGEVWCWGLYPGEIVGKPGFEPIQPPQRVEGFPEPIVELTSGGGWACALGESGAVYCWGRAPAELFGAAQGKTALKPTRIDVQTEVTRFGHAGGSLMCIIVGGGEVRCWGRLDASNYDAPVGDASPLKGVSGAVAVATTRAEGCALLDTGDLSCWSSGQPPTIRATPRGVTELVSGTDDFCARNAEGVWCWDGLGEATPLDL
ncbi:MAG: hypothetical protein KC766_03630 [Myxococcales bacterium]|nr:hypothetical protein [Myxococcales bacterium]